MSADPNFVAAFDITGVALAATFINPDNIFLPMPYSGMFNVYSLFFVFVILLVICFVNDKSTNFFTSVFGKDTSLLPLDITLGVSVGFKYEYGITEFDFSGVDISLLSLNIALGVSVGFKYEYGITESDPPERDLTIVSGPSPFTSPVRAASFLLPEFNTVTTGDFPKPPETLTFGSYFAASLAIPVVSSSGA